MFLGVIIFFLFSICCDYFIAWGSLIFYIMEYSGEYNVFYITGICIGTEKVLWFELIVELQVEVYERAKCFSVAAIILLLEIP